MKSKRDMAFDRILNDEGKLEDIRRIIVTGFEIMAERILELDDEE